jgi:DNA-directed RNA polymerase beta subunit
MKSASVSSTMYVVPEMNSDLKESSMKVKIAPKKRTTKQKETVLDASPINTNPETTNDIKKIIAEESDIQKQIEYIHANITNDETKLLEHLGNYTEEPFHIIESYFEGQHLDRLVRHQIESYNHFVNYQILRTIQMFNPVTIHSENDYIAEKDKYFLEIFISFTNFKLYPPQIHENNGATKMMLPQEAKLRNFTYASTMTVDVNIQYVVRNTENMDTPKIIEKVLPKINIGKLPIMLKSSVCTLTQNKFVNHQYTGECSMDCGGYFIIKGSEKTVLGQERAAENRVYCFDGKNTTKWNWFAEIKSVPDFKCISPKQIEMMIASKNNGFGNGIYVNIPRIKQPIELFVLFRALGVLSDKEISQYILLDITDKKQVDLLQCLQASMIDANKYMTQEDALRHITASVAFTPINMDKDTGARKKREFTIEVLDNDLFPHCQTVPQKLYLVGYMAKKLLQTSLGWLPPDDRDSYLNKRIELTGTLLNNLFRNYFNKLVKEMQKQIVREINTGSWRSTEDYENIINMTNIYKIMKSTTIENGINRALSTGDFSIKQSNSSKVGVAQVLNRLTYVSSLSHLRRINTPLEKSGELIAPRKLHNTTFGFLCAVETPEGQSIGVVKNISYMGHITIPTNSSSLYEYVKPYLLSVNDTSPTEMHGKVKVFVNGAWLGVTDTPMELYNDMKDKKYRGIINIYISIVFDYKSLEIRICNDGGRLTRPVLKVRDNKALISADIIDKLVSKEISWNDLLTNCKLDESVIEYIDPEEQNFAMIAMKSKEGYLQDLTQKFNYTHCEIHPSTIFGVLASCIPYPEHNQAPRNTYQCLSPNELVWMADGSKKCIKDVSIGENVLSFNPETLEITETAVVNQFVRKNEFPIYKLKTVSGREIIATEDHKLMTNKGWKTIGQMKENINEYKIGILNDTKNMLDFKSTEYLKIKNTEFNQQRIETAPADSHSSWSMTNKDFNAPEGTIEILSGLNIDNWMNVIVEEKNNCIFVPLESITPEPDGLVSDIEVESDNHSFIAGSNFLSSNCAMGKQAMGVYATNYDQRMDKTAYVLNYPSRPLVDTRLMNFIHLNRIPSGTQIHVAIMSHTGYNQEDSVLINKGSIDRGLFLATIYHTEKDEDKNIIRDEIIRCNPDPTKTKGIKFGNYDKLNPHGFIPENELVENRDVIIAKTIPIKENRNDPTKTIKYEDQSKTFRTTEETYIDKNYTGRNGDGYNFAKVRVRVLRKPVFGDKFSSRAGQKGTVGNIIPECDMPFTNEGLRPDIIINPHAIPSRMTIGQLKETLLGKVLLELGLFGDGTSFGNLDIKTITAELQKLGYESYGNELLYNGLTGEQLETNIFIGPVFYQRLKHMVNDKQHSRSIGPMVNLTRQPAEGRSRDGGFRIGEMERDVMLAHGMSRFCRERLYDVSDKYSVHVCKKCGMVAPFNDGNKNRMYANADFTIHLCKTCNNKTEFAKVEIPYAYKLMSQELQTINVVPRIITE